MTQTVAKECSWSRGKASKKVTGTLSLTLMDKAQKFSRGYSSGFVPDYRHAVEAVGESEGLVSPGHVGSEDSYAPKRRCISLNADRCDGFFIPLQVITLSKLSNLERKELETRLKRELELVQKLQNKIFPNTTLMSNGAAVSSSCDPLAKKLDLTGQNISQLKRGATGRFESAKHVPAPTAVSVLMKQCETLLKRLLGHQYAWVFNKPVDVVKLNIPDYFTVIKQPMDLGTIQSNLSSGFYTSPMDFASDVRLTFSNALTYNPPGNDVHAMADVMSKYFEMRWKPIAKKLVAAGVATKGVSGTAMPAPQTMNRKIPQEVPTFVLDNRSKMTCEEKLNLSRRLSLIPELPKHIVDFLKLHTDNADQNNEDEIEIDFDSLSVDALFELKKLLDDYSKQNKQQEKTEPYEIEILNVSGLSNSSMHPCKGNGTVDDEDVDICGNDPPTISYFPVGGVNSAAPRSSRGSSSNSSSSEPGSSSTDSDSGNTSRSRSNAKASSSPNTAKGNGPQIASRQGKGPTSGVQPELGAHMKSKLAEPNEGREGENAPSERQVSPDKLYRAALLRSRFADTILKAREKTLDQGEKKDPEKLRREREELERQHHEERMRLQAEAKAAEEARRRAEEEAAAKAKRKRELEREAARQALLQMEKTVEINEGSLFFKDLEMLRTAPGEHVPNEGIPVCSNEAMDDFKLGGSNPLEQLGLYMKVDDDDDEDEFCDRPINLPDVEEGEID